MPSRAEADAGRAAASGAAYAHYLAGKLALYHDDVAGARRVSCDGGGRGARSADDRRRARARARKGEARERPRRDVLATARKTWPDHRRSWLASGDVLEKPERRKADAIRRLPPRDRARARATSGLPRARAHAAAPAIRGRRAHAAVVGRESARLRRRSLSARAAARRANGDRTAAIEQLRAVLEREPDHLDARLDLARTLRRMGKLDEAVAQTRSAFDRAGQPMDIAEELFWLLCEADDRQGAIDLLTLLDDDRSDADALATVARLETRARPARRGERDRQAPRGRARPAGDARGRGRAPRSPGRRARRAGLRDLRRSGARAAVRGAACRRRLRAGPRDGECRRADRARARDRGHRPAAVAIAERVLRRHPDNVLALNLTGYLLADTKQRLRDAEVYLRRAHKLSPGDPAYLRQPRLGRSIRRATRRRPRSCSRTPRGSRRSSPRSSYTSPPRAVAASCSTAPPRCTRPPISSAGSRPCER